jgi:peptidoglycan/xylan/chitin deacetylase (PgdA/CDA1 family)
MSVAGRALMKTRAAVCSGLYASGASRLIAGIGRESVRYCILAYHGISKDPLPLFTSAKLFEDHLRLLTRWGCVTTMDEVARFLAGEPTPDGPKTRFVLGFDDGYANVVRHAVPLLRQYGTRGIIYVNPGWLDRGAVPWWFQIAGTNSRARHLRRLLAERGFARNGDSSGADAGSWPRQLIDELLARVPQEGFDQWWEEATSSLPAVANGELSDFRLASWTQLQSATDVLDVGSHTASHCILGLCRDPEFARQQIVSAKEAIERRLGRICAHFAYPRGEAADYNAQTQQLLVAAGHETAVTMRKAVALRGENPLAIPRFYVGETPVAELAAEFAGIAGRWDSSVGRVRSWLGR